MFRLMSNLLLAGPVEVNDFLLAISGRHLYFLWLLLELVGVVGMTERMVSFSIVWAVYIV